MTVSQTDAFSTRKLVFMALLVAMGLGLHMVEDLLAFVTILPGLKLGLANIITLISFSFLSKKETGLIVLVRMILLGILSGRMMTPGYIIGAMGAFLSYIMMAVFAGNENTSIIGVSLIGAAAHNLGQIMGVMFLLSGTESLYYLPWLLLWSVPMGFFTGVWGNISVYALRKIRFSAKI